MRSSSAHMTAMLATRQHRRARCLYLALEDGTVLGITDHDANLLVDMPDISDVPVTYYSNVGITPSDISMSVGLDADSLEVTGPLTALVTKDAVLGKRFSRAMARIFEVDWNAADQGMVPIIGGNVADTNVRGGKFVFEIRSLFDFLNQSIGRLLSPYCSADLGDELCTVPRPTFTAAVVAVTDEYRFQIDLGGVYADDYFLKGAVEFFTGSLAGTKEVEIVGYDGTTADVVLIAPLADEPQIGDQLYIKRGCSKLKISADAALPTCKTYNNVLNFRGFDQVPGSDTYLRPALPGANGA